MHGMLLIALLACGWASSATSGDSCSMVNIDFCTCKEYDFRISKEATLQYTSTVDITNYDWYPTIHTWGSDPSYPLETVAPTTSPRTRDTTKQILINCNLANSTNDYSSLQKVASSLFRKWVDKLSIEKVPLEKEMVVARFPSLWLKDARIRQFEVGHSKLAGDFIWKGNPFAGQDHTLLWFAAIDCALTGSLTYDTLGTANTRGLDELPRLEALDLSENHLVSIESSAFGHAHPKLKTIVLSKNIIEQVSPGAFHLARLQHVDLSHNVLLNISRDIFSEEPTDLRRINLSWNKLQILPEDLFSNMPALRVVDVSSNFLFSMPKEPWNSVWWQLRKIDVSNNFVECNCELLWLVSNNTLMKKATMNRRIKGQCFRSLNSLLAIRYDLASLTYDKLDCKSDDEKGEDDEYDSFDYGLESN